MPDRREAAPLPVGAAVRFAHEGKTIHGHLVRPQRGRRLAQVIDATDRIWRVHESALTGTGAARRATIVTPQDAARAGFRVGDDVTFASAEGLRRGVIARLNPQRAKVRCGPTCWNVPYGLLRPAETQEPRSGAERLREVAGMSRRLMDAHGLTDWTLAFVEARRRLGDCCQRERTIRIGRAHALEGSEAQIRDTVLHEIAHAIAGPKAGHGPLWRATARRIGATPRARAYESDAT